MPSQDASALLFLKDNGQPTGYTSITDSLGQGSSGWERAGTPYVYVPLVQDASYNRSSVIYVTNTGTKDTTVSVTFYNPVGTSYSGGSFVLSPHLRHTINVGTYTPNNNVYSARLTSSNNQPLAAVVLERDDYPLNNRPGMYNAFSSSSYSLLGPMVKKNFYSHTTGIALQNVSTTTATFTATYYDMNGQQVGSPVTGSIPANSPYVLYNPSQIPDNFLGTVKISSTAPLVGQMTEADVSGGSVQMYNLVFGGSTQVHLPLQ